MKILAIESSCDETGVAIFDVEKNGDAIVLHNRAHTLHSQAALHAPYGGVFPTLAKREHAKNFVPLLTTALSEAGELAPVAQKPPQEKIAELMKVLEREQELFVHLLMFFAT
jgi:tRNA A37 threonylcarbamoyltransferase TsaD